jgi:putative DNA primase/helicase
MYYPKTVSPLSVVEANELKKIVDLVNWEDDRSAYYLAGWCVIAPICGALDWRPHIWLTGPSSAGKSWVVREIVKKCLDNFCKSVSGSVTEAGIRQSLGIHSKSVVFDESEAEDKAGQDRIQSILALTRTSSNEDDSTNTKGSANGIAVDYKIRSSFLLSSIGVSLENTADKTRFTELRLILPGENVMSKETRDARWKELQHRVFSTMTKEWGARFRARSISMIPVIRANYEVFLKIASEKFGSSRYGNQIGALLAGAQSLRSDRVISVEEAQEWFNSRDWDMQRDKIKNNDEKNCLSIILDSLIKINTAEGVREYSISELLHRCKFGISDGFTISDADDHEHDALKRRGIRLDDSKQYICIACRHSEIKSMLEKTAWSKTYAGILENIPGHISNKSCRFVGEVKKAIFIPWSFVFPED